MDDLDKLLLDLQSSIPSSPSIAPNASNLMQELELMEQDLEQNNKRISQVPKSSRRSLQTSKSFTEKVTIVAIGARICHSCEEPIAKNGSVLNGKYYHNEHFVCNKCNVSLKNVLVFDLDGKLWCERDYHKKYSPECHYCHEPIKAGGIEAIGKSFHDDHFFCAQCGTNLLNQEYMEYQGQAFCAEDYATLFATRCASCVQPLLQDYISALGKNYHPECFTCSAQGCTKVLPKAGFYHQRDLPYCEYHFYELSENICAQCNEIILGRCIIAVGKKFHAVHFKCTFCQKQLDQTGYKERNTKPYCPGCYVKLFA